MSVDPPRWPHILNLSIKYVIIVQKLLCDDNVFQNTFYEIAQTSLKGVDCLLLTSLTMTPLHNPNPMIGEFCQTVCDTIRQGGNVLVPCYPSGKNKNIYPYIGVFACIVINFFPQA